MNKLKIKNIPELDRPYEKMEKYGAKVLSDSELLAIIIQSGTCKINSIEIAKMLLSQNTNGLKGFEYIAKASIQELTTYPGIGKTKAIQIKACIEIAKRYKEIEYNLNKIKSPQDVYNLLKYEMRDLEVEEIKVIILNSKAMIKSITVVSRGALNSSCITMKEILSEPIKQMAASIIIVHNHPSGDTTPSRADVTFTRNVVENARLFDIEVMDHIVIGKDNYTSIKEMYSDIFLKGRLI